MLDTLLQQTIGKNQKEIYSFVNWNKTDIYSENTPVEISKNWNNSKI